MRKVAKNEVGLFPNMSLGKLPQKLITGRENFVLELWEQMRKDGAVANYNSEGEIKKIENTLPAGFDRDNFIEYLNYHFREINFKTDKRYAGFTRYQVFFGNVGLTFSPQSVAQIAFEVVGPSVLKPHSNVNPTALTPKNRELMDYMKNFTAFDDETRPALRKVLFDDKGIVASNGLVLFQIKGSVERIGLYDLNAESDTANPFPAYENIIPKQDLLYVEFPTKEFISAIKQVDKVIQTKRLRKMLISIENYTCTIEHNDPDFETEAKVMVNCQYTGIPFKFGINYTNLKPYINNVLSKSKKDSFVLEFSSPNRAIVINNQNTPFGESFFLFMPNPIGSDYGIYIPETFTEYTEKFIDRKVAYFRSLSQPNTEDKTKKLALLKLKLKLQTQTLQLRQQAA